MRLSYLLPCLALAVASTLSYGLDKPTGRVLLTVTGAIEYTNSSNGAQFDREMLESLPKHSVTTQNPWTQGLHTYTGFSASDLLDQLGNQGTQLKVIALNQYVANIPLADFTKRGAIFATHKDGKVMSIRDLGPIMVVYPFDDDESLKTETFYGRSIWQVERIDTQVLTE